MKKLFASLLIAASVFPFGAEANVSQRYQEQYNQQVRQDQECMSMFNNAQFDGTSVSERKEFPIFGNSTNARKYVDSQGKVYSVTNISNNCKIFEEWRVWNAVVGITREMPNWEGTYIIEEDGLIDYQETGGVIDRVVYPFI